MASEPPNVTEFMAMTELLGCLGVRSVGQSGAIFVFIPPSIDESSLDYIRMLARRFWPGRPIVLGRRSTHQTPRWMASNTDESGPVEITRVDEDEEARSKAS
jgi:hypothetical protein